jgi:hypothetical protein
VRRDVERVPRAADELRAAVRQRRQFEFAARAAERAVQVRRGESRGTGTARSADRAARSRRKAPQAGPLILLSAVLISNIRSSQQATTDWWVVPRTIDPSAVL